MLRVTDVHAGYGPIKVLHGISLEVGDRETVVLLGRNGTGKTTLIRTISGLITATAGSIEFAGRDIQNLRPHKIVGHGLIHVREGKSTFLGQTVFENLMLGAYRRRVSKQEIGDEIDGILELFPRLQRLIKRPAAMLSGGEQRMLAIGQALMAKPQLMILDEPSHGLAPLVVDEVYDVIATLRERGMAILIAEQFAEKAMAVCDRAYVLDDGKTVLEGTGRELEESVKVQEIYLGTLCMDA
ncbi:MAG: ABC transporter ATP-binding protein [Chloroflexota bacterium]|nr:MAG: ABC transporter ATP-binding protein [Chloroflexota bacterium]